MQKKVILVFFILFGITSVMAECSLKVALVNQDPFYAVPGDYVRILFQVSGIDSSDCGDISFRLLENYPLSFDPGFNSTQTLNSGTFARGYTPNWMIPYNVRIDPNSLDGDAEIEVEYTTQGRRFLRFSEKFNLKIKEVKADFTVFIRSYDYSTNKLTLEILNTAQSDVSSLVLKIPSQENIRILGGNRNIIGDLDANDYTSADFEGIPKDGKIQLELEYTDQIGERRTVEKEIAFESSYFVHTKPANSSFVRNVAIVAVIVVAFFVWHFFRKKKKKAARSD